MARHELLVYECPRCFRASPWTDGTRADAGDDRDEFWCQVCGEETPLQRCQQFTVSLCVPDFEDVPF